MSFLWYYKSYSKMPGEMEIIEAPHSGKNGSNQKFVGGSRKLLQLFRLKPLRWRSKQTGVEKEKEQSPDERRDKLDRDMKNNWEQLPATLRRRKEKLSQAVLDQFTEDITPAEDDIQLDLGTNLEEQNRVIQKVSDDGIHASPLEDGQPSGDKQSGEPVDPELDSASAESLNVSSSSSQIIVRPEIHRECSDSSLEYVENTADALDIEISDNGHIVPPSKQETGVEGETEAEAQTVINIQTDSRDKVSEHNTETSIPTHTEAELKDKPVTQPASENRTQENELLTATCSKEMVTQNSFHSTIMVDRFLTPREKDEVSLSNKNGKCVDQNEILDDNSDKNKTDLSHSEMISETSDDMKSDRCDSDDTELKSKTDFKLFVPNESYLYSSGYKDKNMSVHCDISTSLTNSKLPATKEFNQESPRASTSLSHEEQQVMALLSRAVSEDSLLIPSSPSSTSASSVTSSVDEKNRDSGTDINSPSPSTSSSSVESVSTTAYRGVTDTAMHYKNPKNLSKSVEKLNEDKKVDGEAVMITSLPVSQDTGSATDLGIEKLLVPQSTGNNAPSSSSSSSSSPPPPPISNTIKNSRILKHNEKTPAKFPIDGTSSANFKTVSSSTSGCFSSLSDDPSLYEVVIPRAEYHKPSHIALKTVEYQAPIDKHVHEVNHDDINKTHLHPANCPAKVESLRRDEEDVMSYYDAVLQEEQTPNKECANNRDNIGNGPIHPKPMKAVMDGKEYEYIAKGLYINDYVHFEMKNQKSVCNGRSENRYVGSGNAFAKRYAAMEFAKPAASSADLSRDNTFAKSTVDCKDKVLLPDTPGNTWKRPFGLDTLNKKPLAMATIMEEREGEADTNAATPNISDSEKLTVREILRRFEELGGHVQLPTDITQVEGDSDADKSATLRNIQETLRCLEEKVRHHETKATTTQTQEADENSIGEKLQQKAVSHIPDGVTTPKIALDGWTGHTRSTVHQQSTVLHSHTNTTPTHHHQHHQQQHAVITLSPQPTDPPGHHDGKHSLLQFAMLHFRQSPEKFEMLKTADGSISGSLKVIESLKTNKKNKGKKGNKDNDWTWKEQVDLVKFSAMPVEQSLLRLEPGELSELAVECFAAIMRYMGDLPMAPDSTEVKCVYTILMHCHKHEALRDEVYCQLMKQTTNNKSIKPDSCQRGWRLFSIVAAYFVCSDTLKPYLFKYLETAAYDKRRAYHGTATVCLQNLRKTFKYGGRKNVPSVEEITAISAGRNSKRQIYRLPGGTERVVNTKSTTVVQDVIEELCTIIGVTGGEMEMEEFSLYCIVEGDTFTMPLAREEYILDVTTELHKNQQVFYLIFCRSVWHFPLRLDSQLYVEVVFNQIAPDYLEGLLLIMPGEQLDQDAIYDIAKMAALLHRAADMTHVPTMKETKFLLPKPALTVRDVKPAQWVNMVQSNWRDVEMLTTIQAKAQVLDILSKWPLFGSSFFAVKRVSDPKERSDHILALNRHGVHFIDLITHETLIHYPFSEVISTRKVKSEDGTLFLDMKCGNLMQQRITRLQTDQAHEISRLIRQYITMEQRLQQRSAA